MEPSGVGGGMTVESSAPPAAPNRWLALFGTLIAWAWTVVCGGGGIEYLWEAGPMKLTHGWFALASGLAACPLTAWGLKRYAGVHFSGWARFAAATLFIVAGRLALLAGL
jgi:hypothetical protein